MSPDRWRAWCQTATIQSNQSGGGGGLPHQSVPLSCLPEVAQQLLRGAQGLACAVHLLLAPPQQQLLPQRGAPACRRAIRNVVPSTGNIIAVKQ